MPLTCFNASYAQPPDALRAFDFADYFILDFRVPALLTLLFSYAGLF